MEQLRVITTKTQDGPQHAVGMYKKKLVNRSAGATDLLASWMSAMAMRILFRRKMRTKIRMASTTQRMITGEN